MVKAAAEHYILVRKECNYSVTLLLIEFIIDSFADHFVYRKSL